jgi:alpha-1,2-mannosyltransferase
VALLSGAWTRLTGKASVAHVLTRKSLLISVLAWLVALGAVGLTVRTDLTNSPDFRLVDLGVYRNGGLTVLHGGQLYAMHFRSRLLFTYPPVAGVLAVPLGLLPWRAAQLAWIPMVYVPLAIAVRLAFRPLLARARGYAPAVFAGLFAGCAYLLPLRQEMHLGQVDILLVALCLLDCATVRPRWPRGMLIGLATAIKLVPGVFIVYLLLTGRRKAAGVATLTFAALSGLAWAVAPQDSARYWSSAVFDSRRLGPNMPAANQALRGMLMRSFFPSAMPTAVWLGIALLVAVGGFAAARAAARRGHELAGIASTGMLAALLSPVAWIHHLCWIVVALGVLVGDGRRPRRVAVAAVTGALFVSSLPLWGKVLLTTGGAPVLVARVVEDAFGLAALALIVIMYRIRYSDADTGLTATSAETDGSAPAAENMLLTGSRDT